MDSKSLSLLSFNTRGLREKKKRENLFYWLKHNNIKITLLQETYWTSELLQTIETEWDGKVFLNPGTNHSKGTAVLFNKQLPFDILNTHQSEDGRIILINLKIEDKALTLVNIYAPNSSKERKNFFSKLQKWIYKFSVNKEVIILGGDFNFTESAILDRHNNYSNTTDVSSTAYKTLKEKHSLHNIWRVMHPNKKQFTYREHSRLDKFLVSELCLNYTLNSCILHPGIKSDHKCVKITLKFENTKKGPEVETEYKHLK